MTSFHEIFPGFITEIEQLDLPTSAKTPGFVTQLDLAHRCGEKLTKARFVLGAALYAITLHEMFSERVPNLAADSSIPIRKPYFDAIKDHPKYEQKLHLLASYENGMTSEKISCSIVPSASRKMYIPVSEKCETAFSEFIEGYDFASCNKRLIMADIIKTNALVENVDYFDWHVNPFATATADHVFSGFCGIVPLFTRTFLQFLREAIVKHIYVCDNVELKTFSCVNNTILHALHRDHMFVFVKAAHELFNSEIYSVALATFGKKFDQRDALLTAARNADMKFAPFFNGSTMGEVTKILDSIISLLKGVVNDEKKRAELFETYLEKLSVCRQDNETAINDNVDLIMDMVLSRWESAKERRQKSLESETLAEAEVDIE